MANVNQILAPKKCKHVSRDALNRCYGIYEISKIVLLSSRSAIFSQISPQNSIFTKLQKHSFHGQMAHVNQILTPKKCKHVSRDAPDRCYGIYEMSKAVSLFGRWAIFSQIFPPKQHMA